MSMAEKLIEDFGEKIGGARKDLYALNRELRYGDIIDWNSLEREKFITKKEAFPLPNYEKMLKEGKDREVLFFIKKVYIFLLSFFSSSQSSIQFRYAKNKFISAI